MRKENKPSKDGTSDSVVQIAWLVQGLDVYQRSNGKMGHSLEKTMHYVISSVTRLLDKEVS